MVYNTQDYWVFGLCPSSDILKTQKNTFRKLDLFPSSGEGETPTPASEMLCYFVLLEYKTMDKVQKPSNLKKIDSHAPK
jgi:hypothetical protein